MIFVVFYSIRIRDVITQWDVVRLPNKTIIICIISVSRIEFCRCQTMDRRPNILLRRNKNRKKDE